jgi:hypothetical protein
VVALLGGERRCGVDDRADVIGEAFGPELGVEACDLDGVAKARVPSQF